MTSFLFIPAPCDHVGARRVDFGNIATLFAESEEIPRHDQAWRGIFRLVAAMALGLLAIGDTIMVSRSVAFGAAPAPHAMSARSTL